MDSRNPNTISCLLLITNDATTRDEAVASLPSSRFRILEATTVEQGLKLVQQEQVDLVLLDVDEYGVRALDFCGATGAKSDQPLPPVVLLASADQLEVVHRGHEFGVRDVIAKPILKAFFPQRVRFLVDGASERRHLEHTLDRMKEAQTFAKMGDWEWTPATGCLEFSDEARQILGLEATALVPTVDRVLRKVPKEDRPRVRAWLDDSSKGGFENSIEHPIRVPDGEDRIVRQHAIVHQDFVGLPQRISVVVTDVTEWRQADIENKYQASHDLVTGLDNHASFLHRLEEASWIVNRSGERFAVLYLGVAKFGRIHESMGHRFGDEILARVGERLNGALRKTDRIACVEGVGRQPRLARINGANFAILLQSIGTVEEVARLAQRINDMFAEPIVHEEKEFFLSTHIGVAVYPDDGQQSEDLLRLAQSAMTRCSHEGRTHVQFATSQMNDDALERLTLEASLRHAIELDQFVPYYQPKVDVQSGKIAGMEALIRWIHPEDGLVPPGKFISIAEESGIIVPMGEFMLRESCKQAKAWQDAGYEPFPIAVNVSMEQFRRADIVAVVAGVLEETGLDPRWLELELTESAVMDNTEDNIVVLRRLKDLGVLLSVDDFGTGYSSLSYLRQFPIDVLKIDRSFVIDLPDDSDAATIVTTIVHMSRSLGLKLIAEGVETEPQLSFLRMLGCDQYQGYLFSKPVPAPDAEQLLAKQAAEDGARIHKGDFGDSGKRSA